MCRRYLITSPAEAIRRLFNTKGQSPYLRPRYNVAPIQDAPVVRLRDGERELAMLRWGLIPGWSEDPNIAYSTINARAETVDKRSTFRDAFNSRRCLVIADGFYEWQARGKEPKQPYIITRADGEPIAFAGLWERWVRGDEALETFTIIVTEPNTLLKPIHNRMPVILQNEHYEAWLSGQAGKELLVPCPAEQLTTVPVSTRVNNPAHDDPDCIEPLTSGESTRVRTGAVSLI